jgi:predicted AAA+ superfamily ATPase
LKRGFFPDVVLGNIDPFEFFREYLDLVMYKDIIERFGVRNRYASSFSLNPAFPQTPHYFPFIRSSIP